MRIRRTAILLVLVSMLSATVAHGFAVTDWLTTLEHRVLGGWKDSMLSVLGDEVRQIQAMARRLSVFTNLAK